MTCGDGCFTELYTALTHIHTHIPAYLITFLLVFSCSLPHYFTDSLTNSLTFLHTLERGALCLTFNSWFTGNSTHTTRVPHPLTHKLSSSSLSLTHQYFVWHSHALTEHIRTGLQLFLVVAWAHTNSCWITHVLNCDLSPLLAGLEALRIERWYYLQHKYRFFTLRPWISWGLWRGSCLDMYVEMLQCSASYM